MLKYIREFERHVLITGLKNVEIDDVDGFLRLVRKQENAGVETQFFCPLHVATWQHLYFALLNALIAFRNGQQISKNLPMETMLFASAQNQIDKAVKILGLSPPISEIAVLIINEKPEVLESMLAGIIRQANAREDETILDLTGEKMRIIQGVFEISDRELEVVAERHSVKEALVDLIIERMALQATER